MTSCDEMCIYAFQMKEKDEAVARMLNDVKLGNPNLKPNTLTIYKRQIRKLVYDYLSGFHSEASEGTIFEMYGNIPRFFIMETDKVIKLITDKEQSDRTKKNNIAVILSALKYRTSEKPYEYEESRRIYKQSHEEYTKSYNLLAQTINALETQQKPNTEGEKLLQHLTMDKLRLALNKHKKDYKDNNTYDSLMMYFLGHLHLDQVLRNEGATLYLSNELDWYRENNQSVYRETNFIDCSNHNYKTLIINNNKVRNPERPDWKPKQVKLNKECNWAVNKLLRELRINSNETHDNMDKWLNTKGLWWNKTQGHGGEDDTITTANYTRILNKIWEHKNWKLNSTLIRKLYAIEVRNKYKGKLKEEEEACFKLDHSKDTHDKNYILYFD